MAPVYQAWRPPERYLEYGLQGIERDLPRGVPPVNVDVAKLVEMTTQTTPEAATHCSTRKMDAALGVSASTVMRHWQAHGLEAPHRSRLQGLARSSIYRKARRHRVPVHVAARACAGPHTARTAAEARARGNHDTRLQRCGTTTLFAALNVLEDKSSPSASSATGTSSG